MEDLLQDTLSTRINRAFDNLIEYGESVTYFLDEIEVSAGELIADHKKLKLVSNMAMDFINTLGFHEEFTEFVKELRDRSVEESADNVIPFTKK